MDIPITILFPQSYYANAVHASQVTMATSGWLLLLMMMMVESSQALSLARK